ncbi:P-loop containing nucleoside triphosphate hydrolase protein [Macrolepiota fuliginosa MF-IS2]|uniref:RNA helicase n=1 Tax=Macrolepiota fuliginosa MF-IS2 TaxID=1400762 RepID=A0A9P5XQR8_9AGAR|nr:P-loop containing nucleoside triphosphate hydrolase protein [Macrolepiota fuliginosa MF-IS2]
MQSVLRVNPRFSRSLVFSRTLGQCEKLHYPSRGLATLPSEPEPITLRRSYLYVPSSSDRMLEKTKTSASDVFIYDLEDSVSPVPSDKANARERLRTFLNVSLPNVTNLVLPKIHYAKDLDYVSELVHEIYKSTDREAPLNIIPSIESARAMLDLGKIAGWKSKAGTQMGGILSALLFAAEDYCADTGILRTNSRRELLYTRSQIVIAAKAFGLEAIDMVCVQYKDLKVLEDECLDGRQLGFTGKQAIHPTQVATIQATYVPASQEILRAAKILYQMKLAHESEKGAVGLEGEMIDAPMLKQAEKTISIARAAGLTIPDVSSSLWYVSFTNYVTKNPLNTILWVASSSKSADALYTTLSSFGLPNSSAAHEFVNQVYSRAPRKRKHKHSAEDAARKQAEKEAKALRSQRFGFLLEDEAESHEKDKDKDKERDRKDRHMRKRDYDEKEWESDEEEKARKRWKGEEGAGRGREDDDDEVMAVDDEDEGTKREKERLEDLRDRDAFAERMRERDRERTKKIVEDRSSKAATGGAAAEAAQRRQLAEDADARDAALPSLRLHSRQEYLTKREIQQIELLKKEIADDEALFVGMRVSKREKQELDRKKELLRLVEERLKINDKWDGYQLPEDYITEQGKIDKKKKENALYKRYDEAKPKDDQFTTDVDQWEAHQTQMSTFKTGALDKKELVDDYEYVFDESQTIKFVMESALPGVGMSAADKLLQKQIDEAEKRAKSIEETRKNLPIYQYKQDIIDAVRQHQVLIVVAETGSGKTTQLPQYLHEAGFTANGQKIGCTQPRRVAAMSVAARVADEMGTKVGYEVGYSIRFEDCTSDKTDIARFRPELRLLISSATVDAEKFSEYFDGAPAFYVPGRQFPVDIHYTPQPEANYLHAAITTVFQIHMSQPKGDVLVFLTGQEEIEACQENLQETARALGNKIAELIICPIYANLPSEMQAKIFEPTPAGARKVVLATNIAETSITIDGVVFVIDPGFVKQNSYNPRTGMSSLIVVPCSRASANQRAGRAGRVGPGKAFRLYTKWAFSNELEEHTVPEIQRTNLGMVVLLLKSLGINDLIGFEFLDPPPGETLMRALEMLYALGALNDRGELTKLGRRMAEFPVDPMLSKAIISSEKYGCTDEVLTIIAMLSESGSLFYRPKDKKLHADQARQNFVRPGGDHFTLLNVWEQWAETNYSQQFCYEQFLQFKSLSRARDIRDQLAGLCERVEIVIQSNVNSNDIMPVQKAITAGYFYNTAQLQKSGDSYRTMKTNHTVYIHPSSSLFQFQPPVKTVLYYELVMTSKSYMRQVMEIKPAWLLEVAPHYFKPADLEQLATGDKKMPKAIGASTLKS